MRKLVPIVEGFGEVDAVPALLSRILIAMEVWDVQIASPKNAHGCGNLTKRDGIEKFVGYAQLDRSCSGILILMDADETCGVAKARLLARRVQTMGVRVPTVIVFAQCEYESWFLASLETIAGQPLGERPGLPSNVVCPDKHELKVGVKSWLDQQFPLGRIYKETEDQLVMTRLMDFNLARQRSRSFRRLWHAIEEAVAAMDSGAIIVTPAVE